MRETVLWRRLEHLHGPAYARSWASQVVMADLGGRTVVEALDAGLPVVRVWRAVWGQLELPESLR